MATSQIAHDHDAVEVEIFVAAPPARVYQAITDPAQTAQWWGQKGKYRVTNSHADLRCWSRRLRVSVVIGPFWDLVHSRHIAQLSMSR